MESVAINHHEKVRLEFEKTMKKLFPNKDLLRFKSGAYRNHETYNLFMAFASGYASAAVEVLGVKEGM